MSTTHDLAKLQHDVQIPYDRQQWSQKRITQVQEDPAVRELKARYPFYKFHPVDLFEFGKNQQNCRNCPGLGQCSNQRPGYRLEFFEQDMDLNAPFRPQPCEEHQASVKQKQIANKIRSHHVPDDVLNMTFTKFDFDERTLVIKAALKYCTEFKPNQTKTGLYLKGSFGVGKSAIGGAIAQELAQRNVDVAMVYVEDFLNEVKSSIKTGDVEEKINALKSVSVLILDDIGAETISQWTRDSVLAPILQARMTSGLPTIYTSNLTLQELQNHLAHTKDGPPDYMKAARIMERIEPFVTVYEVRGKNRRRDAEGA